MNRGNANKPTMNRQRFSHESWDALSGVPDGYRPEYAWVIPQVGGGMSARNNLAGAGAVANLNLAGGLNAEATLAGAGALTGLGALIVSLAAALSGSGTINSATTQAFLNLAATLAGAGDLDGALTALGNAAASLSGSGAATGTATALGTLAAQIVVTGDLLNTANVGQAVWAALQAAINNPGTAGAALLAAGSAGDPWSTSLPGSYTDPQAGAILSALQTLVDELHRIHGLNAGAPLEVTDSSREAGAITQTIVEAPAGTVTVTRT